MPHSSTERPFTPPPGYSIVDRRGCFCRPGEPGSLSPVIFVTFESLLSSIPPQLHLLFFEGRDERRKEIAKKIIILPTTRNSNSQSHFSYGFLLCFLFHPPRFFPPTSSTSFYSPFSRYISEHYRESSLEFYSLKLLFDVCKVAKLLISLLIQRMQCLETANNFSARMAAYIPFS